MLRMWTIFGILLIMTSSVRGGTPQQASAIRRAYEASMEAWKVKLELAENYEAQRKIAVEAPSAEKAARKIWRVIKDDLNQEWTLESAAWFLPLAGTVVSVGEDGTSSPAMAREVNAVRSAVLKHHVGSPALVPICMALVSIGDNDSLDLLRKIETTNTHSEVKGVAALGIAILSKNYGDDPRVMRERLTMLRKAIIGAADVDLGGATVAELAEEELYEIQYLSKGQIAPDLVGIDSGGRPMKLSDYEGKVVMLVFWSSGNDEAEGLIQLMKATRADPRFEGKSFEIVGVSNDPTNKLRDMQREGEVDWPNFSDPEGELAREYRVRVRPLAMILGPDRELHYSGSVGTFAELTAAALVAE